MKINLLADIPLKQYVPTIFGLSFIINIVFIMVENATISITAKERYVEVLTPAALKFLEALHIRFNDRRLSLLADRRARQATIDDGLLPGFLEETAHIRKANWKVADLPQDLIDRRVEITGPVNRKMIINALNSGAKVFMADFEDSSTPTWSNMMHGQINLRDAIRREIDFAHDNGKYYALHEETATLMVRPRGWHLEEQNICIGDDCMSGSLVDFGLYFFHNAKELISRHSGPYFYLPKLESHHEARLWNDVFVFAQEYLSIPQGTIKATVLIETILAAFEMDEILYELKEHSAGLNCGRWDYIFSYIKKLKSHPEFICPDRAQVTMSTHFMKSYSELVIRTCHRRGVHAMGGMAAQIPIKNDPEANQQAILKVRSDKLQEVRNGHDGTWVAHPALVPIATEIFDHHMSTPHQIHNLRTDVSVTAEDLLRPPSGTITERGLRLNINVGILYIESWLRGHGAAALYHLMEDAATAEISRTQVWQWLDRGCRLDDGRPITKELYQIFRDEEIENIKSLIGSEQFYSGQFEKAISLFDDLVLSEEYVEFLTLPAYQLL